MIKFENKHKCQFCANQFNWKYLKPETGEAVFYHIENTIKNVINYTETNRQYIVELQCPYCLKRQFVDIEK